MAQRSIAAVGLVGLGALPVQALYPYDVLQCQAGAPAMKTELMTTCQYRQITNAVISTWSALSTACTEDDCQQAEWSGCIMRMAGHDFLDYKEGSGGSDGCTNLDVDNNKGLAKCLYEGNFGLSLGQAYQPFCQQVSLADFLVIAAEAVMMVTRRQVNGAAPLDFKSTFKFGRQTVRSCPEAGAAMPNPEGTCNEVDRVLLQNMGLDWREAAALSGAHNLGRAQAQQSGYNGWWTGPNNARKFSNQYFVSMLLRGWMPQKTVSGNGGKNQWRISDGQRAQGHHMMLNTDMCLAYASTKPVDGTPEMLNAAQTTCCAWSAPNSVSATLAQGHKFCGAPSLPPDFAAERALCCDNNPHQQDCAHPNGGGGVAYAHIKEFSENDAAWIDTFRAAWTKATENGMGGQLRQLEPCDGTEEETPGLLHFDCAAEETNWERGWSELKKGFCCKDAGVGCEEDYDCVAGADNWQKGWSEAKKYHCCKETGLSCAGMFDCQAGVENWERGWSALKKSHCCKTEQIGCTTQIVRKYESQVQIGEKTSSSSTVLAISAVVGATLGLTALRAWVNTRHGDQSQRLVEPDAPSE